MITAAVVRSLRVSRIRQQADPRCPLVALDQRHNRDTGLEPGQSQGELGKHQQCNDRYEQRVGVLADEQARPLPDDVGMAEKLPSRNHDDHEVQR
jgi:hypothetical protein